jgi:hypothetical protein
MGTRSTIAIEFADQSVSQIYCHWDGYLENNGKILAQHYTNPFKVKELVELGGFSSLRPTIDETAESAYTQRGESCDINRFMDLEDYEDNCQQEEYDYILRQVEGQATWFVRCYATDGKWISLETAFAELMNQEECE